MAEGKSEVESRNRVSTDHDVPHQLNKTSVRLVILEVFEAYNAGTNALTRKKRDYKKPFLSPGIISIVAGRKEKLVERAPGFGLHRFLSSICPPKFRERELDALHADAVELYFEKLKAGDSWGAWRVKWAMRGWMLWTVFGGALGAVVTLVFGKAKSSK